MKLFEGSCEEILKTLPDASVDAVICDPPYGKLAFQKWDKLVDYGVVCKELKRIMKPKAACLIFCDYKTIFDFQRAFTDNKFTYRYFFTWSKSNVFTGCMHVNRMPLNNVENILVFSPTSANVNYYADGEVIKRKFAYRYAVDFKHCTDAKDIHEFDMKQMIDMLKRGEASPDVSFTSRAGFKTISSAFAKIKMTSVLEHIDDFVLHDDYIERTSESHKGVSRMILEYPTEAKIDRLHPTQKPIALMKKLVELYSKEGDVILDFTMGSGSTGEAALALGRSFIGIEKDHDYYEVAKARLSAFNEEEKEQ